MVDMTAKETPIRALHSARASMAQGYMYSPELVPGIIRVAECAVVALCGVSFWIDPRLYNSDYALQHWFCVIFICLVHQILSKWASLYTMNAIMRPISNADSVILAIGTSFLFLFSVIFGLDNSYIFTMDWFFYFFISTTVSVVLLRLLAFKFLQMLSSAQIIGRNLVILGIEAQSARFLRKMLRDPPYFTTVAGVFSADGSDAPKSVEGFPVIGSIDELLSHARQGLVDDIVVAMPWSDDTRVITTIEKLKELPVNVYLGSDLVGFDLAFRPVLGAFSQLPVFEVIQRPISGWSSTLKLMVDYTAAAVALAVLAPLMLIVAIAIKLDSPGPVFFLQHRLGFNNKPFSIYKFRSMRSDAEGGGAVRQATRGDPRVTRVGRIIRATSIDELPQLFNVLNGTMSLVGPRPHALSHNEEYGRQIRGYFARHKVKPGITGWAQVNGLRGETADVETMRRRVEHDVYYVENWSFLFDIRIMITTVLVVLFQKTAY